MAKTVTIDGVEYVPKTTIPEKQVPPELNKQRLYNVLDQLRTDIGTMRDKMNIQNDVDELDRLGAMANLAIGILIGTSR